jgi:hypothetical protein
MLKFKNIYSSSKEKIEKENKKSFSILKCFYFGHEIFKIK